MIGAIPEPLAGLLDDAARDGCVVPVWWRDDDAVADTPALRRLLGLARQHAAPVAIAAVAGRIEASLPRQIAGDPRVSVLVHGLTHRNHAPSGEKSAEFGPHRPLAAMTQDLRRARDAIRAAFPEHALDMFVPPWNRIAPGLPPLLPELGFAALSTFGDAGSAPVPRLAVLNTHLDPVDWRGGRSLAAAETLSASLGAALGYVAGRRPVGPVGLLSHHLAFDAPLWAFWERLLDALARHPAVRLTAVADLIALPVSSNCTGPVALG